MKLAELSFACYIYSHMTDYDESYNRLVDATRPQLDLDQRPHRMALLKWLNDWGCRQFSVACHELASKEIWEWFRANEPRMFSVDRTLLSLSDADLAPGFPDHDIALSTMAEPEPGEVVEINRDTVKQKILDALPQGYWWPIFSRGLSILVKAIEEAVRLGLRARVMGAATVSEAYKLADLLLTLSQAPIGEPNFMFLNTGTIDRYESLWAVSPAQYNKATIETPVVLREALRKQMANRYEQARLPKLILPGMVKRLESAIDNEGTVLAGKSTVIVVTEDSSELPFLQSLINSRLLSYIYNELFGSLALQGGFLTVGPPQVERLPIRRIEFTSSPEQRTHWLEQGKALYQGCLQSSEWSNVISLVEQCLPNKPDSTPDREHERSDVVHDLLAFLAEEMTRLHKEKLTGIKAFLGWLESEILKGSIEGLKNKTAIREFHENSFEDLLDVLKKNRVVRDPCPSNIRDTVAGEFSAAMSVITPLKARIEATDKLIDRIVYRLYNLTPDEIAIVEGQ